MMSIIGQFHEVGVKDIFLQKFFPVSVRLLNNVFTFAIEWLCFLQNAFSLFCNSMTILAIIEGQFSDAIKSLQKNRKKSEAKLKENWKKIERNRYVELS